MRRRVLGVLAVTISSGPIGALHVGWLATQIGTDTAVLAIAIVGFMLTATTVLASRKYRVVFRDIGDEINNSSRRATFRTFAIVIAISGVPIDSRHCE